MFFSIRSDVSLNKFFQTLDIDSGTPSLRQKLTEHGIHDWEKFLQKFEDKIVKKFAGVLVQCVQDILDVHRVETH